MRIISALSFHLLLYCMYIVCLPPIVLASFIWKFNFRLNRKKKKKCYDNMANNVQHRKNFQWHYESLYWLKLILMIKYFGKQYFERNSWAKVIKQIIVSLIWFFFLRSFRYLLAAGLTLTFEFLFIILIHNILSLLMLFLELQYTDSWFIWVMNFFHIARFFIQFEKHTWGGNYFPIKTVNEI